MPHGARPSSPDPWHGTHEVLTKPHWPLVRGLPSGVRSGRVTITPVNDTKSIATAVPSFTPVVWSNNRVQSWHVAGRALRKRSEMPLFIHCKQNLISALQRSLTKTGPATSKTKRAGGSSPWIENNNVVRMRSASLTNVTASASQPSAGLVGPPRHTHTIRLTATPLPTNWLTDAHTARGR